MAEAQVPQDEFVKIDPTELPQAVMQTLAKDYEGASVKAVSYTHLDVYKRQVCMFAVHTMVMADNDRPIQVNQLPAKAQTFIKTYFKNHKVTIHQ